MNQQPELRDHVDLGAVVEDGQPRPETRVRMPLSMLDRHGLVSGATGSGKTRTLQLMAEQLSDAGVSVFVADIKGDLSGIAIPGEASERLLTRALAIGQDWQPQGFPTEFYSLGGRADGVPLRSSVSSFGPLLMSKALGLNDIQTSALMLVFRYAATTGIPLLDLSDLRDLLSYLSSDAGRTEGLGGISGATAGVILRSLVTLQGQGGDEFFGEPEFDTSDLIRTDDQGRGVISVARLEEVLDRQMLISTFLMWLLATLFRDLPDVDDSRRPRLVFFLDNAHLLFENASEAFLSAVAQTVRLIRLKGVGIFFITHHPADLPERVMQTVDLFILHQLHLNSPTERRLLTQFFKALMLPADTVDQVRGLPNGDAIICARTVAGADHYAVRLLTPQSSMRPMPADWLAKGVAASVLQAKYGEAFDRGYAYNLIARRLEDEPTKMATGKAQFRTIWGS